MSCRKIPISNFSNETTFVPPTHPIVLIYLSADMQNAPLNVKKKFLNSLGEDYGEIKDPLFTLLVWRIRM